MINKRGFTLTELLVSIFIAGMVTVALMSVWRAASIQTSDTQRQTMMRNNISNFIRQIQIDISEADAVLNPYSVDGREEHISGGSSCPAFTIIKNKIVDGEFVVPAKNFEGNNIDPAVGIAYVFCTDIVFRTEIPLPLSFGDNKIARWSNYVRDTPEEVATVLSYVTNAHVSTRDNTNYNIAFEIYKDYGDGTPPLRYSFDKIFTIGGAGGTRG